MYCRAGNHATPSVEADSPDPQVASRPLASHAGDRVLAPPSLADIHCLTPDAPGTSSYADPDRLKGESSEWNLSSRQRCTANQGVCFHAHRTSRGYRHYCDPWWSVASRVGEGQRQSEKCRLLEQREADNPLLSDAH